MPAFPPHLPDETPRAYDAFVAYCVAGSGRSLDKVAQELHKSKTILARWSMQHDWVSRVAAYDAAVLTERAATLDRLRREEVEAERKRLQRMAQHKDTLANALLEKIGKRLVAFRPEELTPGQLATWLRTLVLLSDSARNDMAVALGIEEWLRHDRDDSSTT